MMSILTIAINEMPSHNLLGRLNKLINTNKMVQNKRKWIIDVFDGYLHALVRY